MCRLLAPDADKYTVDLVRSRPDAIEDVGHEKRLWRRVYPPTGREGLMPLAFVFADTTEAKVDNTVEVLEEAGRRFWAPRRYQTLYREAITAKDYSQAVPVVVTTLEQLTEHGAGSAVWRRLGRKGEQTLTGERSCTSASDLRASRTGVRLLSLPMLGASRCHRIAHAADTDTSPVASPHHRGRRRLHHRHARPTADSRHWPVRRGRRAGVGRPDRAAEAGGRPPGRSTPPPSRGRPPMSRRAVLF
ncbi:hypothetical protein [Streptomyces lateritius]|uniref:hypothetical protein n=1 Tax=Streptomyces lateritius TaxID=67313 RepID=UPI001E573CC8|nr:hypothetical protein [Streptomyces lateritius]